MKDYAAVLVVCGRDRDLSFGVRMSQGVVEKLHEDAHGVVGSLP